MKQKDEENKFFRTSHLMVLGCYTILSTILMAETLLMDWERWAVVPIAAGLILAWTVHIRQLLNADARLGIYSFEMMLAFFFYGIHLTSTFDMAGLMAVIIMVYTMTGRKMLIILCQCTYFITFIYDIIIMGLTADTGFSNLDISRCFLHVMLILLCGWIARNIIDNWNRGMGISREEIEELKEATERLDNFLANVSHEIRTPVNAVMGLSSVLEKENLPEPVMDNIVSISRAGHRVSEQISDILDFTEIDMGKLHANRESYMINSLVNDLLVQLSFTEDYGLDLVIDMEASLPAELVGDSAKIKKILRHMITNGYKFTREGGVYVHIYPVQRDYGINLILEVQDTGIGMSEDEIDNIYEKFYQSDSGRSRTAGGLGIGVPIVNGFAKAMDGVLAIESTPGEGTTVRVSVPQEVVSHLPCLNVADKKNCVVAGFLGFMTTGHPKIREFYMQMIGHLAKGLSLAFHRVQSREELERLLENEKISHLFVGTGEYLENREYIEELSEKMNVALVVDRGFKGDVGKMITKLPKPFYGSQIANFLNHAFDAGGLAMEERISCPGLRTLVVDDEPLNLLVAKGIFESYGMEVSTAPGGEEAIKLCALNEYDLIFMDHMMPGMDGVETMKRIRQNASRSKKDIRIVALTANAISSAKEMFISEGFDAFIPKPIDITDLERVLKHVLPRSAIRYTGVTEKEVKAKAAEKAGEMRVQDEFAQLKAGGLDTDAGIRYSGGDKEFYRQLLEEYVKEYDTKSAEIGKFFEEKNWKEYAIRVHGLKSTSKMIGAGSLSELARELEMSAKAEDAAMVIKRHPQLIPMYESVVAAVSECMGFDGSRDNTEDILEFEPGADGGVDAGASGEDILEFEPEDGSEV
ncbi:MAG: response regulator [Lachnospiraceae bacterium]|nr:response regulator [Lachnospiraceae bacterium]